ncbi:hypothetical protein BgiBS90_026636, partial [Biomphalaria glabrata]
MWSRGLSSSNDKHQADLESLATCMLRVYSLDGLETQEFIYTTDDNVRAMTTSIYDSKDFTSA